MNSSPYNPFVLKVDETFEYLLYLLTLYSVSHRLKKGQGSGQKKGTFDA